MNHATKNDAAINDAAIHALGRRAGIAVEWRDYANQPQRVSTETVMRILAALGLPCGSADELAQSARALEAETLAPLVTGTVGEPIMLPVRAAKLPERVRVTLEGGAAMELPIHAAESGTRLAAIREPGYHSLDLNDRRITLAVAPARCVTVADLAPGERVWGLAAQIYGLRSPGDCGIGDVSGVVALAMQAAASGADVVALSPVHALFSAEPDNFSPYSPSNRLFYNPLHAEPRVLFGAVRVEQALAAAGVAQEARDLEQQAKLIDWPASARVKMALYRQLFADFAAVDLTAAPSTPLGEDFKTFRAAGGTLLENHARFEVLHAQNMRGDSPVWSWSDWPSQWRDPHSEAVKLFAEKHDEEIAFQCFLQWMADRSFAHAQREAKQAGMRVGLLADLAVGMSSAGSHAWTSQSEILVGLEIGAPADLYNAAGQNWGLTTFSPRALRASGFAPFIATLRACLRHAGGVRIDHAMGLLRLWVVPRGTAAKDGAYLAYPVDDLMRLTALESHRHGAIVIGEDLGTVPTGFDKRLADAGVYGMRVLWFERERNRFRPPQAWSAEAVAMTSTHDLATVAGWWRGSDIDTRAPIGMADAERERAERDKDRRSLWRAFRRAGVASGAMPEPAETAAVADGAVKYIAETASKLALLPLEDALALDAQPNLPGTIDQHPNWRRRYPGQATELLAAPAVKQRLAPLSSRGRR